MSSATTFDWLRLGERDLFAVFQFGQAILGIPGWNSGVEFHHTFQFLRNGAIACFQERTIDLRMWARDVALFFELVIRHTWDMGIG